MIAVDSSALMAIVLREAEADRCETALLESQTLIMSAATYAEVMIVAHSRGCGDDLKRLIETLAIDIIPVDDIVAEQVTLVYRVWGKGRHPAALNIMDCFSYALAKDRNCPLLFIGNDFSQTDIESAL